MSGTRFCVIRCKNGIYVVDKKNLAVCIFEDENYEYLEYENKNLTEPDWGKFLKDLTGVDIEFTIYMDKNIDANVTSLDNLHLD